MNKMVQHLKSNPHASINTVLLAACTVMITITLTVIEKSHGRDLKNEKRLSTIELTQTEQEEKNKDQQKDIDTIKEKYATREWVKENFKPKK